MELQEALDDMDASCVAANEERWHAHLTDENNAFDMYANDENNAFNMYAKLRYGADEAFDWSWVKAEWISADATDDDVAQAAAKWAAQYVVAVAEDAVRRYDCASTCCFTSDTQLTDFERQAINAVDDAADLAVVAKMAAATADAADLAVVAKMAAATATSNSAVENYWHLSVEARKAAASAAAKKSVFDNYWHLSGEARDAAASAAVQAVFGNPDLMQRHIIPAVLGDKVSVCEDDRGWVLDLSKLGQIGIRKALKAVQAMCKDWRDACKGWHDEPGLCVRLLPKRAAFRQASINAACNLRTERLGDRQDERAAEYSANATASMTPSTSHPDMSGSINHG